MAELKAGGLAVIIKSRLPDNVGKTVTLVRHIGVMQSHASKKEYDSWLVKSCGASKLTGYLPDGSVVSWYEVFTPSSWLMPIDGEEFQQEDSEQRELISHE